MANAQASITSSESFLARAQRSEERRVRLWLAVLIGMLLVTIARRLAGGVVMTSNMSFFPTIAVLAASIVFQIALLSTLRRANRAMTLLPDMLWRTSAVLDLCVPAAVLNGYHRRRLDRADVDARTAQLFEGFLRARGNPF